jgi:hypothetical protein
MQMLGGPVFRTLERSEEKKNGACFQPFTSFLPNALRVLTPYPKAGLPSSNSARASPADDLSDSLSFVCVWLAVHQVPRSAISLMDCASGPM